MMRSLLTTGFEKIDRKATRAIRAFIDSPAKQGSARWHKLNREMTDAIEEQAAERAEWRPKKIEEMEA